MVLLNCLKPFQNTLMVNIELAQKLEKQIMTVLNTAIIGKCILYLFGYKNGWLAFAHFLQLEMISFAHFLRFQLLTIFAP